MDIPGITIQIPQANQAVKPQDTAKSFQDVLQQTSSQAGMDNTISTQKTAEVKQDLPVEKTRDTQLTKVLNFLAYFVGGIMAIGAMFGALNTMYTAVSSRSVEIATLRALGFSSMPVVMSVIVEAVVLALIGGLIGSALAWLFFNGNAVSTLGGNFSQVVFRLTVSGGLIVTGITWACAIGLIGGLFPAIRAARLPIAEALRAH